jgi:hypothetical protein
VRRLIAAVALGALACAQMSAPPGGPVIKVPPKLVAISPESGAVNVHPKDVELQFDAVLSERPSGSGATDLEGLVLISPRAGEPDVAWHRSRITIKGKRDWKPNTAYTITVLPGLADLRGNVRKEPTTLTFSTGPTIPNTAIRGVLFDWPAGRPVAGGMVEAIAHPDTTIVYLARADSMGRFTVPHAPPGTYTVRGYNDANNDRALAPREPWDSAQVVLHDSARVELLAFIHDTVGPGIQQVSILDSTTLRVTFDKPLDPAQRIDTTLASLTRADSTKVPLVRVVAGPAWDSSRAQAARAADTSRARADTAAQRRNAAPFGRRPGADTTKPPPPPPTMSRPAPPLDIVLELGRPLAPEATYRVAIHNARNLLGKGASSTRTFTVPKAAPPPKAAPEGAKPVPGNRTNAPPAAPRDTSNKPRPAPRDTSASRAPARKPAGREASAASAARASAVHSLAA